ncbi:MAG: alpha/beta hydrolase [Planctomycetota bacterium]|jgi:dipeptidyl aminopeptidase/acylaminoacyl peptidase
MSNQQPGGSRRSRLQWALRPGVAAVAVIALVAVVSATGCMERLFYYPMRGRTDPPPHLAGVESVSFRSADGTRLHGWFIPAGGPALAERIPTILHVHGNAGNIESHVGFTEYLPAAGFNLFIFDYRGYGQSEGRARRRGPLIDDSQAALDTLLARSDVNPSRIGLYAQSLGGAIGLNLMADRPEIGAAVIESSFASWRDMAASAVGGDPPGPFSRLLAALLIGDGQRPDNAVARIDRPVLLFHGTDDTVIPASHSRRLAEAGPSAELVEIAGGEHNTLRWTNPEVEQLTIDFFRKHLAGP